MRRIVVSCVLFLAVSLALFAQDAWIYGKVQLENGVFTYAGRQFEKLSVFSPRGGFLFTTSAKDAAGLSYIQDAKDNPVLVFVEKKGRVVEVPLWSILYVLYGTADNELKLFQ
jgi:hypothetical protein